VGLVSGPARSRRQSWLVVGVGLTAITLFNVTGGSLAVFFYFLTLIASMSATTVGLLRNQPSEHRRPWLAIVGAELCFLPSVLVPEENGHDLSDGVSLPDAAQLAGYLLLAMALTLLLRQRRSDQDDPGRADSLVVVLAAALPAWIFFIEPTVRHLSTIDLHDLAEAAKPAFNVVAIVASIQLILTNRRRTPALWMLGLALTAVFSCDLYLQLWESRPSTLVAHLVSSLVLTGFVGVAAASLHPTVRAGSRPEAVALRSLGIARTAWLTAVLLLPVATTAIWPPQYLPARVVRVALSLLLTVTVVGRIVRNTDARIQREQLASRRATRDDLTGLPNRAKFYEELNLAADQPGRTVALLMVDLNDFKQVNDRHGHQAGDAVLVAFADVLTESVRASEVVARLGGDEFAVLLDVDTADAAVCVAERIVRQAAARRVHLGDGETAISCSIGIAVSEPVATGRPAMNELLHQADQAMYVAKRRRTSGWHLFLPDGTAPLGTAFAEPSVFRGAS
jgi:diguanylate cyclase (GGDEF)-like protein